jgi:hypothetical protein
MVNIAKAGMRIRASFKMNAAQQTPDYSMSINVRASTAFPGCREARCTAPSWTPAIISRRHEMQDDSGGDAGRNGNDCAPPPVRKNAEGKYRQDRQQSEFEKVQCHHSPSWRGSRLALKA